jgi:hypothetical protein
MPRSIAVLAAVAVSLIVAGPASAGVRASATVQSASGGARLAVKVARKGSFGASQRPTGVSVKGGGKTYKLRRRGARTGLGTWRSKVYRGTAATRVAALAGRSVRIVVRSRSGSRTLRKKVRGAAPVGGGEGGETTPAPASGPFEKPAGELTGEAAFAHVSRYFVDSRFTDCPAGWPACAVEERYNHCAGGGQTGNQEYHRYTPSSGSDINAYGQYQVTGAAAHPDGSWGVEYNLYAYGNQTFYSWNVAANGTVTGVYTGPSGEQQQLGPLQWQQPAGC